MTEAQSLERAIHEDVVLCPYNPEWPTRFLAEREAYTLAKTEFTLRVVRGV